MGTKICILVYTVGVICHASGYFTLYWEVTGYDDYHSGLREACRGDVCSSVTNNLCYFEATQALETLALVIGGVGLLFLYFYFFISQTSYDVSLCIASLTAVVFAACCAIPGVIVFGCKTSIPLSWSYTLAVVGGILYGLSAMLIAVYLIQNAEKYAEDKFRMSALP